METIDKLAWIYIRDRNILMTRSRGKDVWYFPGGKREVGETDQQALIREIREEVGVDLVPETLRFVVEFEALAHGKPEGTMLRTRYYEGDFKGELLASSEIEELGYFDSSCPSEILTPMGLLVFRWLKEGGDID